MTDVYRILFTAGPDRPGLVCELSRLLFERGANVEDSRMAVLGGRFAMMILISFGEERTPEVERSLANWQQSTGLQLLQVPADDPAGWRREPALPVRLEVVAMDAPGILSQLTEVLRDRKVNIESLESTLAKAPSSGATLSSVKMRLAVPHTSSLREVKESLLLLADQINLDVLFQPIQEA